MTEFYLFSAVIFYGENAICVLCSTWLCLIKVLSTEFPSTPEYFSKVLSTGPPLGGECSIQLSYEDSSFIQMCYNILKELFVFVNLSFNISEEVPSFKRAER